ncbi:GDP-mannose 4,6-dehydratase [uncultured archaeon]|nr:GDP-mannose 4,6-dehydratase [uncultured archaeon]
MSLVLVTGAGGRMGSALLPALLARGDKVRAVVRPGSRHPFHESIECIEHDLSKAPLPSTAFEGVDKVAHIAGLVGSHPYNELMAANANATKNMLYFCPTSVRKIVIASSISVYGEYKGQVVDESFEARTESPYGKSKLMAEDFARDYVDSLPIVFLRFGMVYGPGFEEGYFAVLDYIKRGKMQIIGDGLNRIPLVHINDVVQAFLVALDKQSERGRAYNICGSEQLTQQELLELAAEALEMPAPTKHIHPAMISMALAMQGFTGKKASLDPENIRQLTMDRAYSIERAKKELGWSPKVKAKDGISEMARLFKESKQA